MTLLTYSINSTHPTITMAQQHSEWNEEQMVTTDAEHPAVSFPKIQQKRMTTGKQPTPKHLASLPTLQNKQQIKQQIRQLQMLKMAQHKGEEEIVNQIEEKMKQVMEILNNGSTTQQQSVVNDEVEFEDEIRLNKQKIKQAMSGNERRLQKSNSKLRHIDRYQNKNTLNLNKRSVSSYEHHEPFKKEKEVEHKKKISLQMDNNQNIIRYKEKPKIGLPPKYGKKQRIESSKKDIKQVNEIKHSENVFDSIHNMLSNPKTRIHSVDSHGDQKQIQKLEKKIKLINEKLGKNEEEQTKQSFRSEELVNNTVHDWKRLSYNGGKFVCRRDSNFEKEIEKVARLQEQNQKKIADFVTNQLELINLNYLERAFSKSHKKQ